MKIGIIGGGSLGLLFAYYLSKNHNVTLYCRTKEQVQTIEAKNIVLIDHHNKNEFFVQTKLSTELNEEDLFIIAVKQYNIQNIIPFLEKMPHTPLLFIQNGDGHLTFLEHLKHQQIFLGIVEHGAVREQFNIVRQNGHGLTRIAIYRGTENDLTRIGQVLHSETFPFVLEKDYKTMVTKKLVANAVINPLTSILNVKNGELIANPYFFSILKTVFLEVVKALDIRDKDQLWNYVYTVCKNTKENESSMLRDLKNEKETEIDGILGTIIQRAEQNNISVPYLQFLFKGVKGKEAYREQFID